MNDIELSYVDDSNQIGIGPDPLVKRIVFYLPEGREALRFESDGDVFIRGEKVDSNVEVYEQFKSWLAEMKR